MANSAQQYGNVADAFAINGDVPSGPVFLIDDIVDSRWTLTVVGQLLRQNGSGPVVPLVLARGRVARQRCLTRSRRCRP